MVRIASPIFGVAVRRSFMLDSCKILRDATPKSLVILDGESMPRVLIHNMGLTSYYLFIFAELGRGTSTYDGMAIAGVRHLFTRVGGFEN